MEFDVSRQIIPHARGRNGERSVSKPSTCSWHIQIATKCCPQRGSRYYSILWSHHEETRELHEERDNARNSSRCTQARKTTHSLDGQQQDVDRTHHGRVNQNGRGQR